MPVLANARHELIARAAEMIDFNASTGEMKWRADRYRVKAGDVAGQAHPRGYWMVTVDQHRMLAHRLAWALHYGEWPERQVDHINGDRRDNRISNLRLATQAENARNSRLRSSNTSGFKGVSKVGARWRATIMVDGKQTSLGRYDSPQEAYQAYLDAAYRLHGEFVRVA